MFTTVNSLRHNPTIKTEIKQYGYKDIMYGFLGYPISQAADITFCNADLVPVGEDQLPHLEQTRKIVRRFNALYSQENPILKEPKPLLSEVPRLVGLDGNSKMGKSLGNAIYLADNEEVVTKKIKSAVTDPNRISLQDKGNPDICVISKYHEVFNKTEYQNICELCKTAQMGCVACKKELGKSINKILASVREKRQYYEANKDLVREYIIDGSEKAIKIGNQMVKRVKEAMKIYI